MLVPNPKLQHCVDKSHYWIPSSANSILLTHPHHISLTHILNHGVQMSRLMTYICSLNGAVTWLLCKSFLSTLIFYLHLSFTEGKVETPFTIILLACDSCLLPMYNCLHFDSWFTSACANSLRKWQFVNSHSADLKAHSTCSSKIFKSPHKKVVLSSRCGSHQHLQFLRFCSTDHYFTRPQWWNKSQYAKRQLT